MTTNNSAMESRQPTTAVTVEDVMTAQSELCIDNSIVPTSEADVIPLNSKEAFKCLSKDKQEEVLALSQSIDVRRISNVMLYGSSVFKDTFNQCGEFIKNERGSQADQAVMAQVIELSKKASESQKEFNNFVVQEPGPLRRTLIKVFGTSKNSTRIKKMELIAATSYKLVGELVSSYAEWLEMLNNAMKDISASFESDTRVLSLLEQYIIAGDMACERIEREIFELQESYRNTGLQSYADDCEELQNGYKAFQIVMDNLKKSRVMYYLSKGQLSLIRNSNHAIQITVNTQARNSMALLEIQIRNAILNEKNKEVINGQKAITSLNESLVKEVSKSIGKTTETAEKLMYYGICNVESAKEAVSTVVTSCNAIKQTASEMLPKMQADTAQLNELIEQLRPCIEEIDRAESRKPNNETNKNYTPDSTVGDGALKF